MVEDIQDRSNGSVSTAVEKEDPVDRRLHEVRMENWPSLIA